MQYSEQHTAVKLNYPVKGNVFDYGVFIKSLNSFELGINTKLLYDSAFLAENYYNGGNQVVLKQSLTFKWGDSVTTKQTFPWLNQNEQPKLINGKMVELPKYVITNVMSKVINNEVVYVINAFGLSNGSKEISLYFSKDGNLIFGTSCGRQECDSIGTFSALADYGLSDTTTYKSIYVFPPQSAGLSEF